MQTGSAFNVIGSRPGDTLRIAVLSLTTYTLAEASIALVPTLQENPNRLMSNDGAPALARSVRWRPYLFLLIAPAVVGAASLVAPRIPAPPAVGDLATFACATLTALSAITALSRAPVPTERRVIILALAAACLALAGFSHALSLPTVAAVAFALVAIGHGVGDFIGSHIEHPGHILPACVVAACIDVTSVLHPSGPSHAVLASPRALSLLTVSFPVFGAAAVAPVIGIGDLLFIALLLGVARTHGLRWWKVAVAAALGVAFAGFLSGMLDRAVPALPLIGAATIGMVHEMRALRRKDRKLAWAFMAGAVALCALALVARFWSLPGQ